MAAQPEPKQQTAFQIPQAKPRGLDDDALGYGAYAGAIADIIAGLTDRDSGLTVGVFGEWGMGKSSLLQMIAEKLNPKGEAAQFLIVKFDAWRYLKQEDVWLALFRKILLKVKNSAQNTKIILNILRDVWTRRISHAPRLTFWSNLIHLSLVGCTVVLLIALPFVIYYNLTELYQSIPRPILELLLLTTGGGLAGLLVFLFRFSAQASASILQNKIQLQLPHLSKAGFERGLPLPVDDFLDDFSAIIESIGLDKPIVVLIDDLDRCPPDQVVPVLEAIKHFGYEEESRKPRGVKPLIVFVLAVDPRAIERAVCGYFKDYHPQPDDRSIERFAREYVEKIVQVPFVLPPLTPAQLYELLDQHSGFKPKKTESSTRSSALSLPVVQLDEETYARVRKILVQGPASRPRAVLQAYSAFSVRWMAIKRRGLAGSFHPETLAVLALLEYAWPPVFTRIRNHPHYFFFLQAVARDEPNPVVTPIDLEELKDLGIPVESTTRPDLASDLNDHELVNLLRLYQLPQGPNQPITLDLPALYRHLTLFASPTVTPSHSSTAEENSPSSSRGSDSRPVPLQSSHIPTHDETYPSSQDGPLISAAAPVSTGHDGMIYYLGEQELIWEALTSGEMVKIKSSSSTQPEKIAQLRYRILIRLIELIDTLRSLPAGQLFSASIPDADKILLAAGQINDDRMVVGIKELLPLMDKLPFKIQLRVVYALAQHAFRNNDEAIQCLIDLMLNRIGQTTGQVRARAAQLLGLCELLVLSKAGNERLLQDYLSILQSDCHEDVLLRRVTLDSSRRAKWRYKALELIEPERNTVMDILELCQEVLVERSPEEESRGGEKPAWPPRLGDYLIEVAIDTNEDNELRQDAFGLLKAYPDQTQAIEWLAKLSRESEDWRPECWQHIGTLLQIGWERQDWKILLYSIAEKNWPEDMIYFVNTLGQTQRVEAVSALAEVYEQAPRGRWREQILAQLYLLSLTSPSAEARMKAGVLWAELAGEEMGE